MNYEYDIFISYRRLGDTREWIESFLVPLLENHLSQELGRNPEIFVDPLLETGTTWPVDLGNKLSRSRVIIALWTKKFLESRWCSCEIGHMLERERINGYRTMGNPGGLIFPAVIHDGETMPISISTIQKVEIQEYFKLTLNKDGQKYTEFEDRIKSQAKSIADAIDNAPAWKQDWQIAAVNSFVQQLYNQQGSSQTHPPRFSN
jgi:TIR domain